MEFPFGHHHRRNEEDDYPPPPPSFPQHHNHHHQNDFPPPPPQPQQPDYRNQQPFYPNQAEIQHHYHQNPSQQEPNYGYPPPQQPDYGYPPPQQSGYSQTTVHHSSHEVNYPRSEPEFTHENRDHNYNRHDYHNRPENQTVIHHHSHESGGGGSDFVNKPTVRVYCKAEPNYSLAIRDGKVILARSDPSDLTQHWIKDEKYSVRVKDEEGCPSFALINKATGQAMKHSVGATHPVQLRHYNQNELDESVLWAESKDTGEGYRCIRMINNIRLNLDAFHGDKYSGGVHDGTILVLWEWLNGENQRWKIVRY